MHLDSWLRVYIVFYPAYKECSVTLEIHSYDNTEHTRAEMALG